MNYPYSDDFLIYDYKSHKYRLTEKAAMEHCGINLLERVKDPSIVQAILYQNSTQVYSYMHEYNKDNAMQDYIIAKTEKGRDVIQRAMEQQLIYVSSVGDLRKTADKTKHEIWFDDTARETLFEPISELGVSVMYTGTLWYCSPDKTEW